MSEHYPRFRIQAESGYILAREALSLCFYTPLPHQEIAQPLWRSLELFLRALGPQALGLYGDAEGEWQELDSTGWKLTRDILLKRDGGITQLRDASLENRYGFDYFGKPADAPIVKERPGSVCALRYWLPTEYMEEHGPERVRTLALELAAFLPFSAGHVGLELVGDLDVNDTMNRVHERCFRYPGLDILDLGHVSWEIGTRVRGPAWLTFLGQPALDGLGGVARLREQLRSPGTTVEALDGGRAVITLGTWPEAGDIEQGRSLPAYRELARVLEPWLYREQHAYSLGFTPEDLLRWERRFLD